MIKKKEKTMKTKNMTLFDFLFSHTQKTQTHTIQLEGKKRRKKRAHNTRAFYWIKEEKTRPGGNKEKNMSL